MSAAKTMTGGIIPARAGFTPSREGCSYRHPDHPRSRGVYSSPSFLGLPAPGSSPLARGLRRLSDHLGMAARIIPARAGFTLAHAIRIHTSSDHPRSRGVYTDRQATNRNHHGSSPLARGLRAWKSPHSQRSGIIPARAGFTVSPSSCSRCISDHPRSRGVYLRCAFSAPIMAGSSPLARGLLDGITEIKYAARIIPARAGFTWGSRHALGCLTDHPRSRGVYACGSLESQRTRTLPDPCCLHCRPRVRSAELR